MDTVPSIQWLKANNLYEDANRISFHLKKIFSPCFKITDEKVLILGDQGFKSKRIAPVMAGAYYLAAKSLSLDANLVLQDVRTRGDLADENITQSLDNLEQGNIIFVTMSDKLGSLGDMGKSFRKFCQKKDHRFISALSLGDLTTNHVDSVIEAVDVEYKPLKALHDRMKNELDNANEVHIRTKAGTDLHYNVEGMSAISADGIYHDPGSGGNMPAGEVYIPCKGKKVEGKVVIDGSSRNHKHTVVIKEPITLDIKDGSIVNITGGDEAKKLQEALEWAASKSKHPKSVYRVGELGIGLNPKAKIIGSTLVDEKTLGTAHIGIGSNYWFGGSIYAKIHLDQIFRDPQITIDGKKLEVK